MADNNDILNDKELDSLLSTLGQEVPAPSDYLMARVLADAEAHRPVPGATVGSGATGGLLDGLLTWFGGWKGAGGLVTAGLIGLWIGISPPTALEASTTDLLDQISPDVSIFSDYGELL